MSKFHQLIDPFPRGSSAFRLCSWDNRSAVRSFILLLIIASTVSVDAVGTHGVARGSTLDWAEILYDGDSAVPIPVIVAGDPAGSPPDSPDLRVDPNVPSSPFAGVGSIEIFRPGIGRFICTGTALSRYHILTAGHCVDFIADGVIDVDPANLTFHLNQNGPLSSNVGISQIHLHPDFTGFNNPTLHDDLAILTLSAPLPADMPIYPLLDTEITNGTTFTMVGYGRSGDGITGSTIPPSFSVKRVGYNNADRRRFQDESPPLVREIFDFDFDGPSGTGSMGGPTLGNNIEANLGGGDSGGPSFVFSNGQHYLAGVNTFQLGGGSIPEAPLFGSRGGGMLIHPYRAWIQGIIVPEPGTGALVLGAVILSIGRGRRRARRQTTEK